MDIAICPLAMPYPVRLGPVIYATRDYVALRLRTAAGIDGHAIGYTRDLPVLSALQTLAPEIVQRDASMIRAIGTDLRRAHGQGWGAFVRAVSLVDVALWDVTAKAAGLPLYKLLGAYRDAVPVMAVAGYFADRRPTEDIREEISARAEEGYRIIKVVLPAGDARSDGIYISQLRNALDESVELAVDAHAAWMELGTAIDACRRLDSAGLAFIEDPFGPEHWRLMSQLQQRIRTPLAAGEDVTSIAQFADLLEAVAILRVDATASGGITAAMTAIEMAAGRGCGVIPHVWPALHSQLAAAFPNVRLVETIPAAVGADPINRLLQSEPSIERGMLRLDERPGNGIDLDWEAVSFHASATVSLPQ